MMDVSVIISTFKRAGLLEQTLRSFWSLNKTDLEWEVVVVDNSGDERTREVVSDFGDEISVKYVVESKHGKNRALNTAIPYAQGDLLVFTDDDVIADPNWLLEICEGVERWPGYVVFGGKILPRWPDGKNMPFDHPFFLHAYCIANWDIPEGCYSAHKVWGPNMAIRASVFKDGWKFNENIGPMPGSYVSGSETDLTLRLEKAGLRPIYLPRSVIFHQIRPEQLEIKWLYERAFRQGRRIAYEKGIPTVALIGGIPRWRIRQVCEEFVRYKLSMFSGDKKLQLERGLLYWEIRGIIYEYRKQYVRSAH